LAAAAIATRKGNELAVASGRVIARRLALGAASLADPMTADHGELFRMVPEKVTALSAVSVILQQRSQALVAATTRFAGNEMAIAFKAAGDLALCRTPAELAAA